MNTEPTTTLTQNQARIGAYLCVFILAAVFFFEFSGVDVNQTGVVVNEVGTITRCSARRDQPKNINTSSGSIYVFINSTGERAYRFSRPDAFHHRVVKACQSHAMVRLKYRTYQPLLKSWIGYSLVSLIDAKSGESYFSLDDYLEWGAQNRLMAIIVMGLSAIALVYLVLVWQGIVGKRNVVRVKRNIRISIKNDESLIIKSHEGNGDSWAFLFLFTGLTIWILREVYSGQHPGWLIAAGISLLVAYAYLVEVVNANYISLDDEYLVSFSRPLPWFRKPVAIAVEDIEYFVGSEQMQTTSQGNVLQYSVKIKMRKKSAPRHLFFTRDLAEANAVAELSNEKLGI